MRIIEEIWKDIPDYEGVYQISNLGRVKSIERKIIDKNNHIKSIKECYMTGSDNGNGYLSVMLHKNGKGVRKLIHRLVAQAFIPNVDNLPEVNHKDEDRGNNVVTNLEWISYLGNRVYGTRLERLAASNTIQRPIVQYDFDFNYVAEYQNAPQAMKALNLNNCNQIYKCANKKANTAHGYIWRYKDDDDIYCIPLPGVLLQDIYQYNATTGELVEHFYNYKTAAKKMKISLVVLRKYINTTKVVNNCFWCSRLLSEEEVSTYICEIQKLPVYGVRKKDNRWNAYININKKEIWIGTFKNKDEAIMARLKKEIDLYGLFNAPQKHLFKKYLNINI